MDRNRSDRERCWRHKRVTRRTTMVAATLSSARVLRRPRRTDPRAFIGLFLTVAALAGSISFWVSTSESRPVLVALRDLPVGSTLHSSDLTVAYVRMDDNLYRP